MTDRRRARSARTLLTDPNIISGKSRLDAECPKCGIDDVTLWYFNRGWESPESDDDVWCEECGGVSKASEIEG